MPAYRTTNAHRLWLTLLVVFALQVTTAAPFEWSESRALNGELEIKAAALEPDNADRPVSGDQHHAQHPDQPARDSALPATNRLTRHDAGPGTEIRGPPAGYC